MEMRLQTYIGTPAMLATWLFGVLLVLTPGTMSWSDGWWHVKLLCVILLSGLHGMMSAWRRRFLNDANHRRAGFYRVMNEVPTLLMIIIVLMVVVRPF
jgi:putative membrane protein